MTTGTSDLSVSAALPDAVKALLPSMIGLSSLIYSNGDLVTDGVLPQIGDKVTVNGVTYTVLDKEDKGSGYQGLTLYDPLSRAITVVNRGTQGVADVFTDAQMALNTTNPQWLDALDLGSRVAALAADVGAVAIYTTGHSLGGTLTQLQAAYFGWEGFAFNPYGAGELYSALYPNQPISPQAQVFNFRTLFDLVSDASTQIGYSPLTIETPQDVALLNSINGINSPSASLYLDLLTTIGQDHSIANFHSVGDPVGAGLMGSGDNAFTDAQGFSLPPLSSQALAMAQDLVSGLGELIHLQLETNPSIGPFQSGNLSLQQLATNVLNYIANEPLSGIKAVVPSDPTLLANALTPGGANNLYRASLASLSPVIIQGLNPASFANAGLWAPGQTSGLTKEYLTARNGMVQAMITMAGVGQLAGGATTVDAKNSYVYSDFNLSSTPVYTLNGSGGNTYNVVFADNSGDSLSASSGAYAELFGGAGNDTLFGGTVSSTLQGGGGVDDYIINGDGTGVDSILDTDGQGTIEWKSDGATHVLTGGNDQIGTSFWVSADGSITYDEDLAADGSTELEIFSKNKTAVIDDFTNGEFGINLSAATTSSGATNLTSLTKYQYTSYSEYQDLGGGPTSIYGANTTGQTFNVIEGEWDAGYISAGDGNNWVFAGDLRYRASTEVTATPGSVTIQGGSGDQILVGLGNGNETIIGGNSGQDTTAWDTIDGGGANGILADGTQNGVIYGGTGADTLIAGSEAPGSTGPNPTTLAIAGLSFWADSVEIQQGGGSETVTGEPDFSVPAFSDPSQFQVNLSLMQLGGGYAAPIGLLGSSMDSGADAGTAALPGSSLVGGTGFDILIGNSGSDTLNGGSPTNPVAGVVDEVLLGGAGADLIRGGAGTEVIYADMSPGAVAGWANLDPTNADTIYGGSGNEYIYGSGGNDLIYGGTGNYTIYVGNGNSYVDTGSGNSMVYGGTGNDTIVVNGAANDIQTGDGNAYVQAGGGQSTISMGAGDDTIEANGGSNLIQEGGGHTTIVTGPNTGSDTIQSGSGGTTVQVVNGLTESDLVVRDVNGDLVLSDPGFDAQITLKGYFSNTAGLSLQFQDGVTWGASQILQASMMASTYGANDTLVGSDGSDSITAGFGDTSIEGTSGNNTLTGGAGNDTIAGGSGADTIEGGSGTTQIFGGTGLETYRFNIGDGSDTIAGNSTTPGSDVLQFGAGIEASALTFTRPAATNDLLIGLGGLSSSTITITGFFTSGSNVHQVGTLRFADGTTLTENQVLQQFEAIYGTTGSDSITGTSGADYIDGKGGNDYESGAGGNDTFVFNGGYGHLEISENYTSGQLPVLQLGAGITESALHVQVGGFQDEGLVLTDGISGDQITLDNMLNSNSGVQQVLLADGTTLSRDQLIRMETTGGTTGSDTLYGTSAADLFDGKGGNDYEFGEGGSDTFVFNAGYGHLEVIETYTSGQQPVLQLGAGISVSALGVSTDGTNLYLTDGISGDQVKLDNMWSSSGQGVQVVQLADGTSSTLAQLTQMEMVGSASSDTLYGTPNGDLIDGKGGNDLEIGEGGNDTFVFNAGYGHLEISEGYTSGQSPILKLGSGISASALHVAVSVPGWPKTYDAGDLVLTDGISGDQITLDQVCGFPGNAALTEGVQTVQFADGTTLTRAQLIQMASQTAGTTGSDTLSGTTGADLIDGKGGQDYEIGNGGSDTFVFNAGYGQLEINEYYVSGQQPMLQLGVGIATSALRAVYTQTVHGGFGLELTDGVAGDQVTIDNMYGSTDPGLQKVVFSDGETLTANMLLDMASSGKTAAQELPSPAGLAAVTAKSTLADTVTASTERALPNSSQTAIVTGNTTSSDKQSAIGAGDIVFPGTTIPAASGKVAALRQTPVLAAPGLDSGQSTPLTLNAESSNVGPAPSNSGSVSGSPAIPAPNLPSEPSRFEFTWGAASALNDEERIAPGAPTDPFTHDPNDAGAWTSVGVSNTDRMGQGGTPPRSDGESLGNAMVASSRRRSTNLTHVTSVANDMVRALTAQGGLQLHDLGREGDGASSRIQLQDGTLWSLSALEKTMSSLSPDSWHGVSVGKVVPAFGSADLAHAQLVNAMAAFGPVAAANTSLPPAVSEAYAITLAAQAH